MQLEITIETSDSQLISDLLESTASSISVGSQKSISDEAVITLQKVNRRRSIDLLPEIITLGLSLSTSIAANVVSTWLYEKLKGRATTLRIDRRKIQIDKGEIQQIIEEIIEKYE